MTQTSYEIRKYTDSYSSHYVFDTQFDKEGYFQSVTSHKVIVDVELAR